MTHIVWIGTQAGLNAGGRQGRQEEGGAARCGSRHAFRMGGRRRGSGEKMGCWSGRSGAPRISEPRAVAASGAMLSQPAAGAPQAPSRLQMCFVWLAECFKLSSNIIHPETAHGNPSL